MQEEVILDHSLYYNGVVEEHFEGLILSYIIMFPYYLCCVNNKYIKFDNIGFR